jgi:hypothetical protein
MPRVAALRALWRRCWPGLALAVMLLVLAIGYTHWAGPLFDAWDWRATALRALLLVTLALLSLAGVRGDQNPHSHVAPSGMLGMQGSGVASGIPHGQILDPQLLYGGTGVPVADDARSSGDNRWFWIALPPACAFVVLVLPLW